jgi:DNA-binding transcriptional regulator YhcF (GntR family)/predicted kinase
MDSSTGDMKAVGPIKDRVVRHIRNAIEAGALRDGEVLPSTREMAEEWGVSVFTISEAMKVLAGEGLIVNKARSGRIVKAPENAMRSAVRLASPQVILIGGYAGSGKTELGRILTRETGWPILDKDTTTRPVVEIVLEMLGIATNDRESPTYLEKIRPREYEALNATTVENVECGLSVIVTAPFLREFADSAWINRTLANYGALGATTTLVWVDCDADSMYTYLRHRGAARDTGKLANWQAYLDDIDLDFRPPVPHVVVNNATSSEPLQGQARKLLKQVRDGAAR